MTTIDELLTQRRRGALSDADERRLQMAVQTSREHQLTLAAGEVFDRAGVPQSDDAALIQHIVRQVQGEWSGTFQRVVTRRRLSRWVSVPVLIAGVAAASFGGYRALSNVRASSAHARTAPASTAPAAALAAAATPIAAASAPEAASAKAGPPEAVPARFEVAPHESEPRPFVPLAAAESSTPQLPPAETPIAALVPASPAGARSAAAAPASVSAARALAAPHTASWNLPKPRRRAAQHASWDRDVAAVLPMPLVASAAGSASATREVGPDLESAPTLFRRANELRQSDWEAAAALYERLALRHTESREAGVAEMALGKHALSEGHALKAVQWFEAYQRRESGELAAEAIWGEARALQSLGEAERARELWTHLIEHFPASAYAAAAREQLGP
jgi:tetratricopeptide (TPR) repeat protein